MLRLRSLLTDLIVKDSHIFARIYLIFLKHVWRKLERVSVPDLHLSEKIRKAVLN